MDQKSIIGRASRGATLPPEQLLVRSIGKKTRSGPAGELHAPGGPSAMASRSVTRCPWRTVSCYVWTACGEVE